MSILDRAKTLADIAKIGSEIYGVVVDKSRVMRDRDAKIQRLEDELAELRKKMS